MQLNVCKVAPLRSVWRFANLLISSIRDDRSRTAAAIAAAEEPALVESNSGNERSGSQPNAADALLNPWSEFGRLDDQHVAVERIQERLGGFALIGRSPYFQSIAATSS